MTLPSPGTPTVQADPHAAIMAERRRMIATGATTARREDEMRGGELLMASAAYYRAATGRVPEGDVPAAWPFDPASFFPLSARDALVRAGAYAIAELERIQRPRPMAHSTAVDDRLRQILRALRALPND